jgi:solute:Na+ symporter, SSS family
MNLPLLGFIVVYLLVTVAIGWWAARRVKTASDFVVAGKNLPMFVAACALFATWFGSETIMGASTEFVENGLPGVIEDPFGAALCLVLAGVLVARPLYKLNLLTFNDYFRLRFGRRAELVSAFFMVPSYFSWIAAQLVALSLILQSVSGLDRTWGVVLCTSLVLFYTYVGGMWSVAITDFVQTIIIIGGLLILMLDVVAQAGGWGTLMAQTPADKPDFFRFWPKGDSISILQWILAWMTMGLGSVPQQDVFQRVMSARSERASVWACYLSAFMYLTIAFMPLITCYAAVQLHPELLADDSERRQQILPNMLLQHYGLGMQVLFFGALLSAILSTASGAMLAPATVIGENLIKPLYRRSLDDRQLLRLMRWSVVGVAIVTGIMAALRSNIYELVGESSVFSLVSLFVPLIAGLYWPRANGNGAIAAMIGGIGAWVLAVLLLPDVEKLVKPEHPTLLDTVRFFPPMLWGLLASIAGMMLGSFFSKKVKT